MKKKYIKTIVWEDKVEKRKRLMKKIKRYEHNCKSCIFLGQYEEYDLYYCTREDSPVARYGENSQYLSGKSFVDICDPLRIAEERYKIEIRRQKLNKINEKEN